MNATQPNRVFNASSILIWDVTFAIYRLLYILPARLSIAVTAPMKNDPVFAFQYSTLQQALEAWKREQIEAYPHRAELIETVALAMEDFMQSKQVHDYKMLVDPGSDS